MEKKIGGGSKPAIRFGFSWADEVEREEREQQEHEQVVMQQQREAKTERQGRADPFGAARPREVVLAEKGVDWRARDRELDAAPLPRGRRGAAAAATPAARARTAAAAPGRAAVSASARRATPARRGTIIWDREAAGGAGRTPHPQRHADYSRPPPGTGRRNAPPPLGHGAGGGAGGKRKCSAGEGTARRVRPGGGGQGRRVFGELNVADGCSKSDGTERVESSQFAVADGGSRCSREPATTITATATAADKDESAVDRKRRKGRKRGKGRGSKKTENQQTLLL
ncbi:hypothetical protein ACP4OV_020999 [Aristida adscensionis]